MTEPAPSCLANTSCLQRVVRSPALSVPHRRYVAQCMEGDMSLALQLSPHLRLALAAEVAAGMLCPGQPAPPDTPEHAMALRLFVATGFTSLTDELREHDTLAKAATSSSSSSRSSRSSARQHRQAVKRTRLQKLWAHAATTPQRQDQQQQSIGVSAGSSSSSAKMPAAAAAGASVLLPPPSKVRRWPLSPHIDLQLQLPPDLLLKYAALSVAGGVKQAKQADTAAASPHMNQEQQGQGQQQQQGPGQLLCDRVWDHLSQQVQHQGFGDESLKGVALLLREDVLDSLTGILRIEEQLQAHSDGSSSSSSDKGDAADGAAADVAAAAVAEAKAAATAAQARDEHNLPQALAKAATQLAFRAFFEVLAWGDRQQMPLQALQLLAAVRQLEATAHQACSTGTSTAGAAAEEDEGGNAAAAASETVDATAAAQEERAQQAAQQQLVQQSLQLLQHVRTLEAHMQVCGAPYCAAALSVSSGAADSVNGLSGSSGSSGSTGGRNAAAGSSSCSMLDSSVALPPSQFFAADGPLSTYWGVREPAELPGLWQAACDTDPQGAAAEGVNAAAKRAHSEGCSSSQAGAGSSRGSEQPGQRSSSSNGAASSCPAVHQPQDTYHQQQLLQVQTVLQASALAVAAQRQVSAWLVKVLEHQEQGSLLADVDGITAATREGGMQIIGADFGRCSALLERYVSLRGIAMPQHLQDVLTRIWCLHEPLVSLVAHTRAELCSIFGLPSFDAAAWQRLASVGRCLEPSEGRAGSAPQLDSDSSSDSSDWESDWEDSAAAAAAPGSRRAGQGNAGWSCSGGISSSKTRKHWQSAEADGRTQRLVQNMLRGSHIEDVDHARTREVVTEASQNLRDMASSVAAKLLPLQRWHQQYTQRQQQAALRAKKWWKSRERVAAAVAAATGRVERSQGSRSHFAADAEAMAAADSSSSSKVWPAGVHDFNLQCPICQDELKQQQQQQHNQQPVTKDSSSSSSSGGSGPVPYDDPFLWRRLWWRLLGRLSPEAQAFYAHYLTMCPHCCDASTWRLVLGSIEQRLWAGSGVDILDQALTSPHGLASGSRTRFIRQYSRVINLAFCKGYHASTVLVSKQVLLALSPLHHQVLPPPEVAHYLPSSFQPAIGKAVMQQLLQAPVMDGYQHQHCRLQLWHVWWHVGLRRHRWLQQRRQQQPCSCSDERAIEQSSSSSTPPDGSSSSNTWSADCAYLDADAKLYVVGFAARQLAGTTRPSTHHLGSLNLAISMAHQAAQQLLHDTATDALFVTCVTGTTLQAAGPGVLSQFMSELPDVISHLFVIPGVLSMAEPLLQLAATGPTDPLIPLQQQRDLLQVRCMHRRNGGRLRNAMAVERMIMEKCHARHYVRLGHEEQWRNHERELDVQFRHQDSSASDGQDSTQQQQQQQQEVAGAGAEQQQEGQDAQQQQHGRRGALVLRLSDDASDLMLLDPVPAECLLGPEVCWGWHEELTGLNSCDVCGMEVNPQARWVCGACKGSLYCSSACGEKDKHHGLICDRLLSARRRYTVSANSGSSNSGSPDAGEDDDSQTTVPVLGQQKQQQQPTDGLPRVPGLPIVTGLLQPPLHEPGLMGQAAVGAEHWPEGFGQLDDVISALARSSRSF